MSEFVNNINEWVVDTLGTWTVEYFSLWLIVAAALLVILIITFIIAGVGHSKNKKKIKELSAKADDGSKSEVDEAALREKIRAEVIAEVGQGDNSAKLDEAQTAARVLSARVDEQKHTIEVLEDSNKEKQNRINALSSMLEQSNASAGTINKDLYRQINELNQTTREQENEINKLKAENAQIKAQALQQKLAATTPTETKSTAKKSAAAETTATKAAKETKPVKEVKPAPKVVEEDDDDEYDEYYDDYGDENSAIKVTLKFDRAKNNWIVLRSDTDRTYRRLGTKQEALVIAKDLARRLHAQLVVHKKDGKFQKI
ncbi:MAG: DUF2188 domain-containing protein [Clostridiales bacterium]|nr:DUF2188 domain-containing protein [Clostridiales bacterium]